MNAGRIPYEPPSERETEKVREAIERNRNRLNARDRHKAERLTTERDMQKALYRPEDEAE